ncbi:MAG TPA: VOC family protein [Gemmatimonadales bacterium]|jgi:PhnB protein
MPTRIAAWLSVEDGTKAVDFYQAAFGARLLSRLGGDDGGVQVAQLSIGGAVFWVQQDIDTAPNSERPPSVRMILSVDDPDAVLERAVAAGGTLVAPVHEDFGWRTGRFVDPSGHEWEVSKQIIPE